MKIAKTSSRTVTSCHTAIKVYSIYTGRCGGGGGVVTSELYCWEAAASALCWVGSLIEVRSQESLFKDTQHSINTPFALWQSSTGATLINMSPWPPTVNHKSPAGAMNTVQPLDPQLWKTSSFLLSSFSSSCCFPPCLPIPSTHLPLPLLLPLSSSSTNFSLSSFTFFRALASLFLRVL